MLARMPRSPIRSISIPIVLSSIAVLLTVFLLIGWILVLRENQSVTQAIWSNRWLLAAGIVSLALIMCVLVMFSVSLVREILESRRQQMFIDSVTHELKSPLASIKLCLDTHGARRPVGHAAGRTAHDDADGRGAPVGIRR